jgi:hypothetical protein
VSVPARVPLAHGAAEVAWSGPRSRARVSPLLRLFTLALAGSWVLVLAQLGGGVPGELAATVALPLAGALAAAADPRYLGALLTLCLPTLGVVARGSEQIGGHPLDLFFTFPDAVWFVSMGGVELSAPLVVLLGGGARVGWEALRGGGRLRGAVPPLLLWAFLLALGPALLGALQGQALGLNRWSQGVRAMLALGGFFWGVAVARAPGTRPRATAARLLRIGSVASALLLAGVLRNMFLFLAVGLAAGALVHHLRRRRPLEAGLAGAVTAMALAVFTLTTAAAASFALACTALAAPRLRTLRGWLVRGAVLAACAASAALVWAVLALRERTAFELAGRDEGLLVYGLFKLMGDRGPLWLAAAGQVLDGPHLVVPAGRPLFPEDFHYGELVYAWEFGAHNAVLELLRNVGLLSGAAGLALMLAALWSAARVLVRTREPALRALAAGFLGVAAAGVTAGNFPVTDVGFFLWGLGGILAGLHWRERREAREGAAGDASGEDLPPTADAGGRMSLHAP